MKQTVYQGKYISVSEEKINSHTYERITLRAGVHVIPVRNERVLLIREERTHEDTPRWKVVSGWCDKEDKDPLAHAQEELAEEANMSAEHWEEVYQAVVPNATVNPNAWYYLCEGISELPYNHPNPDEGCEVLDKKWFSFEELFELINKKEAWLDHSMAVVLWVLYNKKSGH